MSKARQMQRQAGQRARRVIADPSVIIRQQEATIRQLKQQNAELIHRDNVRTGLYRLSGIAGKIEIQPVKDLPSGSRMLIPVENVVNNVGELKLQNRANIDLVLAIAELRRQCDLIDQRVVKGKQTDLKDDLSGCDSQLMATLQDIRREATAADYSDEGVLSTVAKLAQARIDAITRMSRDDGAELRRVVAETSSDFGKQAEELIQKLKAGFTQGRKAEDVTIRLHTHAKTFYIGSNPKRTWKKAAHACLDDLNNHGGKLDAIDQQIRDEMIRLGEESSGMWLHDAYHNRERQLRSV